MFHILRHELRIFFREPRFWIPFVIPPIIMALSQFIAVSRYGAGIMNGMQGYMMLLLGCLMAPMGAPLAADSFAGERERNSLELLQLLPVKASTLFWGKLLAILPFPIFFAVLVQLAYWVSHPEISVTVALASVLGGLSAVLLTNAFSLLVSLKMKTVRAATHITLFFIVPLLLLVQMGYEYFLQGVFIPVLFLIGSVIVCVVASLLGMRKFVSL